MNKITAKELGEQHVCSGAYGDISGQTLRQRYIEAALTGLCARECSSGGIDIIWISKKAIDVADATLQAEIDSEN
jgi:hypothetical protein